MATIVLQEDFESIADWTASGTWTARTGRSGVGTSAVGTSSTLTFTIPGGNESDTVTVGFAWRVSTLAATRPFLTLRSDAAATSHIFVQVLSTGVIEARLGTTSGTLLAASAAGVVTANTYAYIEIQAKLHDSTGFVTIRVNGTQVAAATNVDTKNAGTKTTFDSLRVQSPAAGITNYYDDLYIVTGSDGTFRGPERYGALNVVLDEPFNNVANWSTTSGTPAIITGRTGSAVDLGTSSTAQIRYTIPSISEHYQVVVGFALLVTGDMATSDFLWLYGDGGTTEHVRLRLSSDGSLSALRAGVGLGVFSAVAAVVVNTFTYVEVLVDVHDTAGAVTIRVNGTTVASGIDLDTRNAGTKTTVDTVRLNGIGSAGHGIYDDLYIRTGALADFLGDHTLGGVNAKTWNGTSFVSAPVKTWNGSAFVDAVAIKTWNGSAFV